MSTAEVGGGRGVIDGAFRLLRVLADRGAGASVSALARETGLPRPTVYRLLDQLVAVGAVDRVDGHYVVGAAMAGFGPRTPAVTALRRSAAGVLETLRERTGTTATLVVPSGEHVRAIRTVHGADPFPFDVYDGMLLPADCAGGIVLDPSRAPDRLDGGHRSAVDDEHLQPGLCCYAAPVCRGPVVVAAVQLGTVGRGPVTRFAPLVHRAAAEISARLRHVPPGPPLTALDR